MMKVYDYQFGSIVVDGKKYESDLYIFPSGSIERRGKDHLIDEDEVKMLTAENPELIIFGKGKYSVAKIDKKAKEFLKEKGIEFIEGNTQDMIREFNEKLGKKKIACIFHLTC
jgi:hypothetical protein